MKSLSLITILFLTLGIIGCSETLPTEAVSVESASLQDASILTPAPVAKKPMQATTTGSFNPGLFADPVNNPSWYGTLTADGVAYGVVWYGLGSGKPFGADNVRGNAFFGAERFEIYTSIAFDPATQTLDSGELLLRGVAEGVMTNKQGVFRAHGRIHEAYGVFAIWEGRPIKEYAEVLFSDIGLPVSFTGTFTVR